MKLTDWIQAISAAISTLVAIAIWWLTKRSVESTDKMLLEIQHERDERRLDRVVPVTNLLGRISQLMDELDPPSKYSLIPHPATKIEYTTRLFQTRLAVSNLADAVEERSFGLADSLRRVSEQMQAIVSMLPSTKPIDEVSVALYVGQVRSELGKAASLLENYA